MKAIQFQETIHQSYRQTMDIERVLFEAKTDCQHLVIFENAQFGRVMTLDGVVQTTENDEYIYHEMLTHVPILAHGEVKKVLIIGGGDGGILRECLRHHTIEAVHMVEIDRQVIDMASEYFPNHSQGAFDHPKAKIIIDDGCRYVAECTEHYDVIICDSTDPIGPGEALFTESFYRDCKSCLTDGGVMVTQNGVLYFQLDELMQSARFFKQLYKAPTFYRAAIPTYVGGDMALGFASDDEQLSNVSIDELTRRFKASGLKTRFYNPAMHHGAFALPQYVCELL